MNDLPKGWVETELGLLLTDVNTGFASGKHNKQNIGIPHLRPMNINIDGEINLEDLKFVEEREFIALQLGDVLFNNTNSPKLLGKTALIRKPNNYAYSNHMTRLEVNKSILPAWVAKFLNYLQKTGYYRLVCKNHVNQASINKTFLQEKVVILLPPLAEQKRIVEKIEALFSRLDAGIAALEKTKAQLKRYKLVITDSLIEKSITDANNKSVNFMLYETIAEENETFVAKELNEWGANGKPGAKPKATFERLEKSSLNHCANLKNVAKNIQIGPFGSLLHASDYIVGGTPLINPQHIVQGKVEHSNKLTVSAEKMLELSKYQLQTGDIILGRRGEMGRCAVITENENQWLCGTGSLFIRMPSQFNPDFIAHYIRSKRVVTFLESSSVGTTMSNLNRDILEKLPVPLIEREIQDDIVQRIDQAHSVADKALETVEHELKKAQALKSKILEYAFTGKLVPQNPDDEPAEVLLERIKAEKEASQSTKKTRKRK